MYFGGIFWEVVKFVVVMCAFQIYTEELLVLFKDAKAKKAG